MCIFRKIVECERLRDANVENNGNFFVVGRSMNYVIVTLPFFTSFLFVISSNTQQATKALTMQILCLVTLDAFLAPIVVRPILPRLVELEMRIQRHRQELQMLELVLADIQSVVLPTIVFRVNEDVRRIVEDSVGERKAMEKKRKWRPTDTASGKKDSKHAKAAEQRRMKLQYKSDRKSNALRRLPAPFVRR